MSILIPCSGFVIHFNCEQWLSSSLSCFRHLQTEIRTSPSPFQWYLGFCRLKQVNIAYLNWSLGNRGKVCVGGGGGLVFWDIPGFIFFWNFFIAFAPLFRTKEESWVPGLLLVLQKACVMHVIHTPSQTIKKSIRTMLLHWRLETCAMFTAFKKKKKSSDITGGAAIWWKKKLGHVPHHNLLPLPLPVLFMLLFYFLFPVCPRGFVGLAWVFSSSYRPCPYSKLMLMNRGEMFKRPIRRIQRNTPHCVCYIC